MTCGSTFRGVVLAATAWTPLVWVGCGSDDSAAQPDAETPDAGTPDSGRACADDLDHIGMLQCLGVDTELGTLVDPNGDNVRDNYNPLTAKRRTLHRRAEIHIAGLRFDDNNREHLWDDDPWGVIYTRNEASPSWLEWPKVSTAGDFDGDGAEEIAIAIVNRDAISADYGQVRLRIVDKDGAAAAVFETLEPFDPVLERAEVDALVGYDGLSRLDIASGDLDGDGRDELAVTCYGHLWVVDDENGGYESLWSHEYTPDHADHHVRVTAGDTDSDGKEELIVAHSNYESDMGQVTYYIYNDNFETEIEPQNIEATIGADTYVLMTADVSVADVDGDRLMEIVFAGRQRGTTDHYEVLVLDDFTQGYSFRPMHYGYDQGTNSPIHRLETGHILGNPGSEIVSFRHVLDGTTLERVQYVGREIHWGLVMDVGDVNGDFRDDIVFVEGGSWNYVHVWGMVGEGPDASWEQIHHSTVPASTTSYGAITTVDIDNDSAILEYVGHELLFTDPLVAAVAVAPPSYADIDTFNLSGTTIGRSSGTGQEYETALGFTAGFTVGFEVEFNFCGLGSKTAFERTVETAVDWISSESLTITKKYFYNGSGDTDKVVFTAIPYDVYYYTVVSSPQAGDVGMPVVINVPREPKTLFVDRDFYNTYNGDAPDVDEEVMDHVVGDPSSYPRGYDIDCDALETTGGYCSEVMTVGQGSGNQTVEICVQEGRGSGTKFDLNITTEVEAKVGVLVMGASAGFHYGRSYTITSTKENYFAGTVANILEEGDWAANMFDFGLYVQPVEVGDQKFPVVGYWVD